MISWDQTSNASLKSAIKLTKNWANSKNSLFSIHSVSLALKNTLEMIREQKLKKYETQMDLGCNFYVQAEW